MTITNTGNVTLDDVTVSDPLTGLSEIVGSLVPGEETTITTSYIVTQEDLDAGMITNTASATGTSPSDNTVEDSDDAEVAGIQNAAIDLVKTSDKETYSTVGEVITYTLAVTNEGNVTISKIVVTDPLTGFESIIESLAPGVTENLTTTYTITQEDLDNGNVVNNASVEGEDPQGNNIGDEDSTSSGASFTPIIANDDDMGVLNAPSGRVMGNILTNDLLDGRQVDPADVDFTFIELDGIIGLVIEEDGTLSVLPGVEPREYTLVYELREKLNPSNKDTAIVRFRIEANQVIPIDDEAVTNQNQPVTINILDNDETTIQPVDPSTVTIVNGPSNGAVTINADGTVEYTPDTNFSGQDTFTYEVCDASLPTIICGTGQVTVTVRPIGMTLTKTVDRTEAVVGDLITYTIILTNNSEFAVNDIVIEDMLPEELMFVSATIQGTDDLIWEIESLGVGETLTIGMQVMAVAPGEVINVVGVNAGAYNLDAEAEAVVIEDPEIDLSITKTSFGAEIYEGDEFVYEIVVENNGVYDANNVVITDQLPTNISYVGSTLEGSSDEIDPSTNVNGNNVTWTVPYFPMGEHLTITLTVKAEQSGSLVNEVTVEGDENEINPSDNTASDQNQIEPFFIPNVITPEDLDNKNDQFEIMGLGKFEQNELVIFNRWGDHVLEVSNYQNDWTAEGLNAGTYFYVLKVVDRQGRNHTFKGWIQVIKGGSQLRNE